jgi:hypothetical protein
MRIFDIHEFIIDEYRKYVQSFLSISDERVREFAKSNLLNQWGGCYTICAFSGNAWGGIGHEANL